MARRYSRHVEQIVEDREQTQQRDVSGWGVPQCGQRHGAIAHSVAAVSSRRGAMCRRGAMPDALAAMPDALAGLRASGSAWGCR